MKVVDSVLLLFTIKVLKTLSIDCLLTLSYLHWSAPDGIDHWKFLFPVRMHNHDRKSNQFEVNWACGHIISKWFDFRSIQIFWSNGKSARTLALNEHLSEKTNRWLTHDSYNKRIHWEKTGTRYTVNTHHVSQSLPSDEQNRLRWSTQIKRSTTRARMPPSLSLPTPQTPGGVVLVIS